MRITPQEQSAALADDALKGKALEPTPELSQLEYESSASGWRLPYDRRWHLTKEQADLVAMKFLDRGKPLAQCNISSLPKNPARKGGFADRDSRTTFAGPWARTSANSSRPAKPSDEARQPHLSRRRAWGGR